MRCTRYSTTSPSSLEGAQLNSAQSFETRSMRRFFGVVGGLPATAGSGSKSAEVKNRSSTGGVGKGPVSVSMPEGVAGGSGSPGSVTEGGGPPSSGGGEASSSLDEQAERAMASRPTAAGPREVLIDAPIGDPEGSGGARG